VQRQRIADIVLDKFKSLPPSAKPGTRPNGVRDWTILAAVVLVKYNEYECVSLAYVIEDCCALLNIVLG
jgi:hypothetical protein